MHCIGLRIKFHQCIILERVKGLYINGSYIQRTEKLIFIKKKIQTQIWDFSPIFTGKTFMKSIIFIFDLYVICFKKVTKNIVL